MDQETSDLLTKWGLNHYVNAFSDARIDIQTLPYLCEAELSSLIGILGDRVRFRTNLEKWKSVNLLSQLPEVPPSDLSRILHDLDSSQAPNNEETGIENINNSVLEILNATIQGRAIIKKGTNTNGPIGTDLRKQLCKLLIRQVIGDNLEAGIPSSKLSKLANDIHKLFPQESPAVYYAPYLPQTEFQAKRNASGLLLNVYTSQKRNFIKLGVLPPPSRIKQRSKASDTQEKEKIIPASGIKISDLQEGDPAECEELLTTLESPDPGPWQDIESYWRITIAPRLQYLYYEKGTLYDYLKRFPILQSPSGYTLLLRDYERLYPNSQDGMTKLEEFSGKILEVARTKLKLTKDTTTKKTIDKLLEQIDENNEVDICLLMLPNIINIPPTRKKGSWKPSRAEFKDGFIIHVPVETEVRPMLAERRNKLAELGVSFQPLTVFCGEPSNITKAYVVIEDTLYQFRTLRTAVDVTFKLVHATGAKYSQESYDIWLLLQVGFYDLKTQFDRQSASLKQVLLDLGLKDKIE